MLHIHNGDSTATTLKEFGFPGEHFAFREVLMVGPVREHLSPGDWTKLRARVLSDEYELDIEDCERDLIRQDKTLARFSEHEEVVLWFEHDLFCQINLIYLLDWFSKRLFEATKVSLICIGKFPGVEDFRGLGQLTGEQLASLFDSRHEVTEAEFGTAAKAWSAYCSNDPEDVARLLAENTSAMPFLRGALYLHLSRFPSLRNGLSHIENFAMRLIESGITNFKSLFPAFAKADPAWGLGDSQFWNDLKRIASANEPLIKINGLDDVNQEFKSDCFHQASFELTKTGAQVLSGERDFVEINGIDRWLGGVHLRDGENLWRWDEQNLRLVRSTP